MPHPRRDIGGRCGGDQPGELALELGEPQPPTRLPRRRNGPPAHPGTADPEQPHHPSPRQPPTPQRTPPLGQALYASWRRHATPNSSRSTSSEQTNGQRSPTKNRTLLDAIAARHSQPAEQPTTTHRAEPPDGRSDPPDDGASDDARGVDAGPDDLTRVDTMPAIRRPNILWGATLAYLTPTSFAKSR